MDPLGALIISFILIYSWGSTCYGLFQTLVGKAAPIEFQRLVIYKAMTFADSIEKIDSCVAYHSGPNYIVEGERQTVSAPGLRFLPFAKSHAKDFSPCLIPFHVPVDIVMSGDTPLWKAHDLSQALQDKLEELPDVDRGGGLA